MCYFFSPPLSTLSISDEKKKKKKKKKSRHNGKQEVEQDKPSLVKSFDSGLVIEELSEGKPRGKKAFVGLKVVVRYTGKLMENDKIFYNNMGEGGEPSEFRLAAGQVIKGFEIGVVAPWKLQTHLDNIKGIMAQLEQTMEDDYEFTLEDENNMLLPYARDQGKMNACYSYSTGEAVQALYASTYSAPPFELSTQQIVDHLPIMFDYKNLKRKKDKVDCYYSNHPDVLEYIWREGLVPRYGIRSFEFVFQRGMPLELKMTYETEKTVEEINDILRQQPMVGATTVYKSFKDFKGEVLTGFSNELFHAKIKGHQGFGRIRRDLVFRHAYPIAPIDIKAEPEKVEVAAPVSKIKNTKPHRSKRSGSTSKTSQHKASAQTQSGVGGKRFGTEAGRKRIHPTHNDIDDINEAKKRCKTNALWGVELKPGKPFTLNFEKERGRLHVSQATLSTGSTSMTSIVQCQVGDKKAICICSLLPEKQERCLLNLEFEEDHEDITFLVIDSHSVHLSGFFYGAIEDCFGDEYASDPYEEGAAEIDSESSDSIKFEDVAEDGDKDGSTDDAFKILEEEEPRDESGTLKRPKKKKHHLNVTDEEENLIVIKCNTDNPLSESEDEDGFSLRESKSKSATSKKSDGIEDEEALNEKARGTDVDERKGLQRIVCEDTSKTYDYQSRGEQIKKKKVMDGEELVGAHPEHVEANPLFPTVEVNSFKLSSLGLEVPNSGGLCPPFHPKELRIFTFIVVLGF
ncbi:Peptidyl-prolyl cis-trans isomerase FKBP53 [Capsicum baccatum]|uniref:peptidylprolyl isomerase n=1 Tax=Capsicum baccatum TaxID=33114 RepID=A0A2G2UYR8_CAPBA|nr:Peptidyl-prolyl cis-trans isomerase FKBP53 [Capsicum baccatum]